MCEDAVPLGEIASGLKGEASRVNSWACAADDKAKTTASDAAMNHNAQILPRAKIDFTLDSDHSDLNMNGFWFK